MAAMRVALLLTALLLAAGLGAVSIAPARADATGSLHWEYRVTVPDPSSGFVHVDLTIRGFDHFRDERYDNPYLVRSFTFHRQSAHGTAENVTPGPHTRFDATGDSFRIEVDGDEEGLSYDVQVREAAYKEGEFLNHLGTDFGLFKSEVLALNFEYGYLEGTTFTNRTTVIVQPPSEWRTAAPWESVGPNTYKLAGERVQPRGYLVMGPFQEETTRELSGKTFQYVRLGKPGAYEADLWGYIEKATPYYEAVYGRVAGSHILMVNAPSPMFHGGLAATDSFLVHENVELRTIAHEYAHVFQRFSTVEVPPGSALWIHEGDADYHSALSLVAAELWGPSDVNAFLEEARRDQDDATLERRALPEAYYGGDLERFAYHKGAVVLRALDELLQDRSDGDVSLSDVVRALNEHYRSGLQPPVRVDNPVLQTVVEDLLDADLSTFFDRFVYGYDWPETTPFVAAGSLVVGELDVTPERAAPGEPVVVTAHVANGGTTPLQRTLQLELNGNATGEPARVELPVGGSDTVEFHLTAPPAGLHELRLLYQRTNLHTLQPANLSLARTSISPETVRADELVTLLLFVDNTGERSGSVQVEVYDGGSMLGFSPSRTVDPMSTEALSIPLRFDAPGARTLQLHLLGPDGTQVHNHTLDVQPAAARDGPGFGIHRDQDGGVTGPLQTPGAGWLATLAAAGLIALARRRRA